MNFKECAEIWYNRALCGTTYDYQYEMRIIINHLNDFIGFREIKDIRWLDIENILLSYARCNPTTKRPSSKRLLTDLRNTSYNICELAIDLGEIHNNPVRRKNLPKTRPAEERRALTKQERELILKTPHKMKLPALIMMFCGLRPGEVIPLEFTDFDITGEQMVLNVVKSVSKITTNEYGVKKGTKNGKCRTITVPAVLANIIAEEQRKSEQNLITAKTDGSMHSPTSWRAAWRSYQNTLNYSVYQNIYGGNEGYYSPNKIPKKIDSITPYMLRHTYATMLYSSNVDILTASKLMGHSEIKTTLKVYTHLEESTVIKNIKKFEDYIDDNYADFLNKL